MGISLAFWILMLVWAVFRFFGAYNAGGTWQGWGGDILLFALFLLLGWHVFGAPIHG